MSESTSSSESRPLLSHSIKPSNDAQPSPHHAVHILDPEPIQRTNTPNGHTKYGATPNDPNGDGSTLATSRAVTPTEHRRSFRFYEANDPTTVPKKVIGDVGTEWHIRAAVWLSLIINIALFITKVYSAVISHSLAVAASAVDSFLDLLAQLIVMFAERGSRGSNRRIYPAGTARLEPVGVVLCAALMGMAALQLILQSVRQLITGWEEGATQEDTEYLSFDAYTIGLLMSTIVVKMLLYLWCHSLREESGTALTLAEDHRNDVLSNSVAAATALAASHWPQCWYLDPAGAILMSVYIAINWFKIGRDQIDRLVGKAAEPEFIDELRELASNHHPQLIPDIVRAYHFGSRFLVELEVLLPPDMSVREAHDISLDLQQCLEQLEDVERAFVHVDYESRPHDEHDWLKIGKQRYLEVFGNISPPVAQRKTQPLIQVQSISLNETKSHAHSHGQGHDGHTHTHDPQPQSSESKSCHKSCCPTSKATETSTSTSSSYSSGSTSNGCHSSSSCH